jgi:hypothetical protein
MVAAFASHLAAGLGLLLWLSAATIGAAPGQSAGRVTPVLDAADFGAVVGADVARRWCAGEEPGQAVEKATLEYFISRSIPPEELTEKTIAALGEEVAIEAIAQAFATCPQRARDVLRVIMK